MLFLQERFLLFSILCFTFLLSSSLKADTYLVTSSSCTGDDSITEAVALANSNPGEDTISVQSGLTIQAAGCSVSASDPYIINVTDSLIIEGNDAKMLGNIAWVTTGGLFTPTDRCPYGTSDVVISDTPGFMSIGYSGQDNSNISVTVRSLNMKEVSAVAKIYESASLVLEDLTLNKIYSVYGGSCGGFAVHAHEGSNFTATRTHWYQAINFGETLLGTIPNAIIASEMNAGDLTIDQSTFNSTGRAGTIFWNGANNSAVNIVSSRGYDAGAIVVGGNAETNIVNTLWVIQDNLGSPAEADRIVNDSSEDMNFIASTLLYPDIICGMECRFNGSLGWLYAQGAGDINFVQSAIGINFPETPATGAQGGLLDTGVSGGSFNADNDTWIQPSLIQDAATLRFLTRNASLLIDAPGLATHSFGNDAQRATPLIGTSAQTGLLIDVISDADCSGANALINPIDSTCITQDVLGNNRVDGNNKRDIGAIQLNLAPHLSISGAANGDVRLLWTQPQDLPSGAITGYAVFYREAGSTTPKSRLDISHGTTLSASVSGLTNGMGYEFEVVSLSALSKGPESNLVTATPLGAISTPTVFAQAESTKVNLSWSIASAGGHTLSKYHVLWKEFGAASWTHSISITDPMTTRTVISGLSKNISYEFGVNAEATDTTSSGIGYAVATPNDDKLINTATSAGSIDALTMAVLLAVAMLRKKVLLALAILITFLCSSPLLASTDELNKSFADNVYLNLNAGFSHLTPDVDETIWKLSPEYNPSIGLGLGYQFNSQWSLDFNYLWLNSIDASSHDGQGSDVKISYSSYNADVYYRINETMNEPISPYVLLGFNHLRIDSSGDSQYVTESKNNQYTIGVGFEIFYSENANYSLEWRRLSGDAHFVGIKIQLFSQ